MSGNTYGKHSKPGVTTTLSNGSVVTADDGPIGTLKDNTVQMWGHSIVLKGEDSVECAACEMEESVPELLQMSSGFREVVYKMYILGKFKRTRCEPEYEMDHSILPDKTPPTYDPNKTYWSSGGRYRVDVGDGFVVTDGATIYKSTSSQYDAGQLLNEKEHLQMVDKCKRQQRNNQAPGNMRLSVNNSIADGTGASRVDYSANSSVDVDADLDEDEKESFKERIKQEMSDLGLMR